MILGNRKTESKYKRRRAVHRLFLLLREGIRAGIKVSAVLEAADTWETC